jgi:hypothetical protein
MQWEELMKIGREEPDLHLNSILKTIGVNECCSVVFTVSIVCVLHRDACGRQTNSNQKHGASPLLSEVYALQYYTHFVVKYCNIWFLVYEYV